MRAGWYQVAYERDLKDGLASSQLGPWDVVVTEWEGAIQVMDARCPHRAAHLGRGGTVQDGSLVCPFHGRRVGLTATACAEYRGAPLPSLAIGGLIFAHLGGGADVDVPAALRELETDCCFVPGFALAVAAPASLVIENAFDAAHFRPVHRIQNDPEFTEAAPRWGDFAVTAEFVIPPSAWQEGADSDVRAPMTARALSPGLVLSHLGGAKPYYLITGATPLSDDTCIVRLSLAIPLGADRTPPREDLCRYLLQQSQAGIRADEGIWQSMDHARAPLWAEGDEAVRGFQAFCSRFPKLTHLP